MTTIALNWHIEGLRWIGTTFICAAEALESRLDRPAHITSSELYFDSDSYLAELRNQVYTRYY